MSFDLFKLTYLIDELSIDKTYPVEKIQELIDLVKDYVTYNKQKEENIISQLNSLKDNFDTSDSEKKVKITALDTENKNLKNFVYNARNDVLGSLVFVFKLYLEKCEKEKYTRKQPTTLELLKDITKLLMLSKTYDGYPNSNNGTIHINEEHTLDEILNTDFSIRDVNHNFITKDDINKIRI